MSNRPHVEIIVSKCGTNKGLYGLRAEEKQPKKWEINWAFAVSEARARSEKYDGNTIQGDFSFAEEYPGCPYCGNGGFFSCGTCGKLTCWDGSKLVTCAHCNTRVEIGGILTQVTTGGDL